MPEQCLQSCEVILHSQNCPDYVGKMVHLLPWHPQLFRKHPITYVIRSVDHEPSWSPNIYNKIIFISYIPWSLSSIGMKKYIVAELYVFKWLLIIWCEQSHINPTLDMTTVLQWRFIERYVIFVMPAGFHMFGLYIVYSFSGLILHSYPSSIFPRWGNTTRESQKWYNVNHPSWTHVGAHVW